MAIWTLSPTDEASEIWSTYELFRRIVVRAQNEGEARRLAKLGTFGNNRRERERPRGALTELPPNPWENPNETSCTEIEPNGTAEMLAIERLL